ncbi:MAG: COX15/CtaA family protein [Ahrensia sp.]|nr:COX15/CtaA family protein [Ahrensia sp.]
MPTSASHAREKDLAAIRWWLYGVAVLVAIMVLVGGATRLTDSGLSITEWAPIRGAIPPLNAADWEDAFAMYRETTEFQTINTVMTMAQFKVIFWWEWGHRFLGRVIGLAFVGPLIWFWLRKAIPPHMKLPLLVLLALGSLQGFVGWWMVRSGLVGRVDVSQIRLAVHLTLACIILAYTLWLARSTVRHEGGALASATWQGVAIVALLLVQIFAGGLVAGLDAGMAYNTWPTMNGEWVPHGVMAAASLLANMTDNAVMVQFNHRNLAYLLWFATFAHMVWLMRIAPDSTHARRSVVLLGLVTTQAALGIVALVLQVPFGWALLHQFGAVALLSFAVAHWHALAPTRHTSNEAKSADIASSVGVPVHGTR